jgi:hypothetical protein
VGALRNFFCSGAVVGLVVLATPAFALAAYGEIAVNYQTGAVAKTWSYRTARGARAGAIAACEKDRRGMGGHCDPVLAVKGHLCGAVVQHDKPVISGGFGPDHRVVSGFAPTQRAAIRQAGPGLLLASVCADAP